MSGKTITKMFRELYLPLIFLFGTLQSCHNPEPESRNYPTDSPDNTLYFKGALIRTDTTRKNISLVFTAHEFSEGYDTIKKVLGKYRIKASFFLTGDFYRNPDFHSRISELFNDGHYLGAHSDKHLLYASWEDRDSLLVTKKEFCDDLQANYHEMEKFGIPRDSALVFLPPYEWYNDSIYSWCKELGIILVNFTPGTIANHDWTFPEPGSLYFSSDSIFKNILAYEESNNMNGFILLLHLGTDPRRTDKFYLKLDQILLELVSRGYQFVRLKDLI